MKRFVIILLFFPSFALSQQLVKYVDPLIGTGPASTPGALKHSESVSENKGQTIPSVGRPFGMIQWTPETRTNELKCIAPYYYTDTVITGFRGTHWLNGSCTQDYGSISLMPFTSALPDSVSSDPVSHFSHSGEIATPYKYTVSLEDYSITVELTGTSRCGIMRCSYPVNNVNCLLIRVNSDEKEGKIWYDERKNRIFCYNPVHRIYQGHGKPAGFSGYFVLEFSHPFRLISEAKDHQSIIVSFGGWKEIVARIGSSFTGLVAATENLEAEISDREPDQVAEEAKNEWEKILGKIKVSGGSEEDLVKFYTALYHCYQAPRIASDVKGTYQGFADDTLIHVAEGFVYYDDFPMWDTYRALHPLLNILEPSATTDMVKSLVAKAQQGGWMPVFPLWGSYTSAMIGDHASAMIAETFLKGNENFDIETAYDYMYKNAFQSPSRDEYTDGKGRRALESYLKYGYIPLEDSVWDAFHKREQVSRTLEYSYDDYALALTAKKLGKKQDFKVLSKRSKNYRNVFDISSGFIRGRYIDGRWIEPFDPYSKQFYITEGTPYQYTWYVPHDLKGLIRLMGGKEMFLRRLEDFFAGNHYWHGNETDQQAPFLFAMAGDPSKTDKLTTDIIQTEYGTGPGGLSGNEDAGQMSAWLVFSMMGFYPVCPVSGEYVICSPSFDNVEIKMPGNKYFIIRCNRKDKKSVYIESIRRNGKRYDERYLEHREILKGGTFTFTITDKPQPVKYPGILELIQSVSFKRKEERNKK